MSSPPFSIVIRTLNSAATLGQVLAALRLDAGDQLVIVDSGSTDGTLALAREHGAEIVPLRRDQFTYGRALNRGFAAARHDWVLSLSSHTVPLAEDFLVRYRRAVAGFPTSVTAVVGPLVNNVHDVAVRSGITYFEGDDLRQGFGFGAGNPNALYRRSAWGLRPFDEILGGGEDLHWYLAALRAGETEAAVHAAQVRNISRAPAKDFVRKGRVDFRAAAALIEPHQPSFGGFVTHLAKLGLYVLLGRAGWRDARNSAAHYYGTWLEARALRRAKS